MKCAPFSVSAMLPVGIRNASITNARNIKAKMKAVINHSKVLATSAALSFRPFFLGLVSDFLVDAINLIR
jgi:hypothetical protein